MHSYSLEANSRCEF